MGQGIVVQQRHGRGGTLWPFWSWVLQLRPVASCRKLHGRNSVQPQDPDTYRLIQGD
jgi:hypothetical protein